MSRPRTPTQTLELQGAFKKNPQRTRVDPASAGDIGEPPSYFNESQRYAWNEVVEIAPRGVLTAADRLLVEMTARLQVEFRYGVMDAQEMGRLMACYAKLGLGPVDRAKLAVAPEKKKTGPNPLAEFLPN